MIKKYIIALFFIVSVINFYTSVQAEVLTSYERSGVGESPGTETLSSHEGASKKDTRYNGWNWNNITLLIRNGGVYAGTMMKLALVRGIYEGARTLDPLREQAVYFQATTYKRIADALDVFYVDEYNRNIPVAEALKVVAMYLRGEEKPAINSKINSMRSVYKQ
ncbi:MAG: hypothetical protein P9L90_02370 [Candidatus Aadella gelida]|nr:hypothetical protein [Candidatus Aadella gelida]